MTTILQSLKRTTVVAAPVATITRAFIEQSDDSFAHAHLLRIMVWQIFIFVCIEAISEVLDNFMSHSALFDLALLGNILIALVLLRRKQMRVACVYCVISLLLFTSLDIILLGETFNPFHACKFALAIVIVGLLFEERPVMTTVIFSSIITLVGMYLQGATATNTAIAKLSHIMGLFGHSYVLLYVSVGIIVGGFARQARKVLAQVNEKTAQLQDQIRQRELAESNVRLLNDELELRVQQRTAELSIANKELESFAYSISHDLRAPLRGIDGWSLALLEDFNDKLNDEGRGYLAQVRAETQRMSELIDDILELSRITRSEVRHETVDLSRLVETIVNPLKTSAPIHPVNVSIQPGVVATGDPHLLRQVLENLLSNAWKFTSKKELAHIEFGCEDGICFVRDDGVGFDMTYANKLFVPFQRLHRASEYVGTGVGLAIVQRIIRRHGGKIWADSKINVGTTFYFTLQSRESTKSRPPEKGVPSTRALLSPIMEKIMEKII